VVQFEGKSGIFVHIGKVGADDQFELISIEAGMSDSSHTEVRLPQAFDLQAAIVTQGSYDLLAKLKNTEEE
jgi:hypothetical protein